MAAATSAGNSLVLMQFTTSGWQPVENGQLIPYTTGVLGDQLAAITILNNANTASLGGSQFCVGYGTSVTEMNSAGRMQLVATIPGSGSAGTATDSCLLISDARVFAYAEANFSSIFAGAPTSGQYEQYDYRYYPDSQNFLGIDTSGVVNLFGPFTADALTPVGQVESFRSYITDWEATMVPISDARVFAFAEANFPDVFAGVGTPGQNQQYNYRYYPSTGYYLAVDTSRVVSIWGPVTNNVVTAVGPVESFRSDITAWEATR